jgi:hypothetical protein
MKIRSLIGLWFGIAALACTASAQVSFTGSYTQNFDSMGTAGTTAPTGWAVYSLSGSHDTFSYAGSDSSITTTFLANSSSNAIVVGTGNSITSEPTLVAHSVSSSSTYDGTTGYNFASSGNTGDRSLGSSPSGNAATELQVSLVNNTSGSLSGLYISYDIDRFTTTTANNSAYTASDPNYGVEECPGYWLFFSLDNGTSWTNVNALNPTLTGANGTIAVPNTTGTTSIPTTQFSLQSTWGSAVNTWAPGSTLDLRWIDDNAQSPSPDQLLGLNNVDITEAVPEPGSRALLGVASVAGLLASRKRRHSGV